MKQQRALQLVNVSLAPSERVFARSGRAAPAARASATFLALACGSFPAVWAVPPFAHVYRIENIERVLADDDIVAESGSIFTWPGFTGAQLQYSLTSIDQQSEVLTARFDVTAQLVWALRAEPVGSVFPSVIADPSSLLGPNVIALARDVGRAAVSYQYDKALRFGIVDATTLAADFAYEVSLPPDSGDEIGDAFEGWALSFDAHSNHLVSRRADEGFAVLAVDLAGNKLFDWAYRSESFLAPEDYVDWSSLRPLEDGTGYYLFVHISQGIPSSADTEDDLDSGVENTLSGGNYSHRCVTSRLDSNGYVIASHSFEIDLGSADPGACLGVPAPDGSVLYTVTDTLTDPATFSARVRTYVIKIGVNGTLDWAHSFDDVLLEFSLFVESEVPSPEVPSAPILLLSGGAFSSSIDFDAREVVSESAGIVARIDWMTGAVTHEFRLPGIPGGSGVLGVFLVDGPYVYTASLVQSPEPEIQLSGIDIIRIDRELTNPVAFRRQREYGWVGQTVSFQDGRFLATEFRASTAEIRAVAMDSSFAALDPACPSFDAVPVAGVAAALQPNPLKVLAQPVLVEATPADTVLIPAELPVQRFDLSVGGCADVAPSPIETADLTY